jgi:hypothetical protein
MYWLPVFPWDEISLCLELYLRIWGPNYGLKVAPREMLCYSFRDGVLLCHAKDLSRHGSGVTT